MIIMTTEQIRKNFIEEKLTWADLLVITGLPSYILNEILSDLFDEYNGVQSVRAI